MNRRILFLISFSAAIFVMALYYSYIKSVSNERDIEPRPLKMLLQVSGNNGELLDHVDNIIGWNDHYFIFNQLNVMGENGFFELTLNKWDVERMHNGKRFFVTVRKEGFGEARSAWIQAGDYNKKIYKIKLLKENLVNFKVVDPKDTPITEAELYLQRKDISEFSFFQLQEHKTLKSDKGGFIKLTGFGEGNYVVKIKKKGFQDYIKNIKFHKGMKKDLKVVMSKGARVYGSIQGTNGKPLIGAELEVEALDMNYPTSGYRMYRAVSDKMGEYDIRAIKAGTYKLSLEIHENNESKKLNRYFIKKFLINKNQKLQINVGSNQFKNKGGVSGELIGYKFTKRPRVEIKEKSFHREARIAVTIANYDGKFNFAGLEPGIYNLSLRGSGEKGTIQINKEIQVISDQVTNIVINGPGAGLKAIVKNSQGELVEQGKVMLFQIINEERVYCGGADIANGGFNIRGIESGTYVLTINDENIYNTDTLMVSSVEIRENEMLDLGELGLKKGNNISVYIKNKEGESVAGVAYQIIKDGTVYYLPGRVFSTEEGLLEIERAPQLPFILNCTLNSFGTQSFYINSEVNHVVLKKAYAKKIKLRGEQPYGVLARLCKADGQLIERAFSKKFIPNLVSNQKGVIHVPPYVPGTYTLRIQREKDFQQSEPFEINDDIDQVFEIQLK